MGPGFPNWKTSPLHWLTSQLQRRVDSSLFTPYLCPQMRDGGLAAPAAQVSQQTCLVWPAAVFEKNGSQRLKTATSHILKRPSVLLLLENRKLWGNWAHVPTRQQWLGTKHSGVAMPGHTVSGLPQSPLLLTTQPTSPFTTFACSLQASEFDKPSSGWFCLADPACRVSTQVPLAPVPCTGV